MDSLRLVTLSYWRFDQAVHRGEMVVHHQVAPDVLDVFEMLFRARFPIRRMVLIDVYRGDDDLSMAANNTSAFNCRAVTGGTAFSEHSYGWAIDVNPLLNPYVAGATVLRPAGARFAIDRWRSRG